MIARKGNGSQSFHCSFILKACEKRFLLDTGPRVWSECVYLEIRKINIPEAACDSVFFLQTPRWKHYEDFSLIFKEQTFEYVHTEALLLSMSGKIGDSGVQGYGIDYGFWTRV